MVPRITIAGLLQKVESNADILIVDSRVDVEQEFDKGHIRGAIPVPLSQITSGQWIPPVGKNKEIIFY
jgi:rhodanese-related sulfurtransferase